MTDLGFLIFLNHDADGDALTALRDGTELFRHAEQLGYDSGWVRVHHGVRTLSSPFPFLTHVAAHTGRIRLGTGVIPVGYEDPLRFAEDAATTDLLSGGRLTLGLSSGIHPGGLSADERGRIVDAKLDGILAALAGEVLAEGASSRPARPEHTAIGDVTPLPHGPVAPGADLVAYPRNPQLAARLSYGAGSLRTALDAARRGLGLLLSTLNADVIGETLGHTQAEIIRRYREAFAEAHPDGTSRVIVSRSILPLRDAEDRAAFGDLAAFYDRLVTDDGRYRDTPGFTGQASPLYAGAPDELAERLHADPAVPLADELLLTPLSELTVAQKRHVFTSVAESVAPALGWTPAGVPA